ncbi:hypothetical protein Clacol_001076 [Clathrus columnatus]|uniref:Flavin-containing monooxygenase n=1 Tax=Clathrus columnatus TaxID=1419009 RepID=A0AAV5A4Q8_9AGAM|nr:hypothetical protein Clacol_001076 [Clathrus columnatus]
MSLTSLDSQIILPPQLEIQLTNQDVQKIAVDFINQFSDAIATGNIESITPFFTPYCLWRDFLALTWDFNTLFRIDSVQKMLESRLAKTQVSNISLAKHRDLAPASSPLPPFRFINVPFEFQTVAGDCTGIAKLVPISSSDDGAIDWKIFILFTNLDQIKGHPDKIGQNRRREPIPNYVRQRQKEIAFEDEDPRVILIGGGHSSLDVAARLKVKDVPSLVLERNPRLGDNWRNRYSSMSLHDFASNWPGHPPASKYADWLEMYAKVMDLNVWTSTTVTHIERDDARDEWVVQVIKADGTPRTFRPKYVVAGVGLGDPYTPDFAGMDKFGGKLMHAYEYSNPEEHIGKKVVVIGSATAAHDVCQDHYEQGIDVTMVQRSSTCVIRSPQGTSIYGGRLAMDNDVPVDIKDRLGASFPYLVLKRLHQVAIKHLIQAEKPFYDGLEKAGFKYNHGPDDAGYLYLVLLKQGRFFIDFGASQLVIDGKIKLKSASIKEFISTGVVFEDGTSLDADIIIFATGVKGFKSDLYKIMKPELVDKIPSFSLSNEGEVQGVYRECGLPNFFPIMGNLAAGRFYSSHISLIIKAKEVGLFTDAYKHTEVYGQVPEVMIIGVVEIEPFSKPEISKSKKSQYIQLYFS